MTSVPTTMGSADKARLVVVGAVVATAALYIIPYGRYVGYPMLLLSTYVHEMGHGIAAMLVGGHFESFHMFADGSGVAHTTGSASRIGVAMVSAGGLVGPAIIGGFFFSISARERLARLGLFVFGAAMLISCVWVVRNLFGWIFVGAMGLGWVTLALKASPGIARAALAFVAAQLALSVFSRGDYLFVSEAVTATGTQPSDVAHMADALFLPYWFWGLCCGLFSAAVLGIGLWLFWRATRPPLTANSGPDVRARA